MRTINKYLEKLKIIRKRKYHPLIHKIHKKYRISKKTLFYIKEYGPHSNILKTILKESIKILIFASIISSLGGLALENVKSVFISFMPLIILTPILNDMIGNYGTIISSRFSTMLHENKIKRKWWLNKEIRELYIQIFIISILAAITSSVIALIISYFSGYALTKLIAYKILLISFINVSLLVSILFFISIFAGIYFYKKQEDPNNFLIPITTSIADFGNMVILSVLIILFFG